MHTMAVQLEPCRARASAAVHTTVDHFKFVDVLDVTNGICNCTGSRVAVPHKEARVFDVSYGMRLQREKCRSCPKYLRARMRWLEAADTARLRVSTCLLALQHRR